MISKISNFVFIFIVHKYLDELSDKYKIDRNLVERLHILEEFEIIILCDDTGSMNMCNHNSEKTPWEKLKEIVKIILHIGTVFDDNGVDVYFVRRPTLFNVTDPKIIDQSFIDNPKRYGSLTPMLQHIFQLPESEVGYDKKLLVFIATDGSLTDELNENTLSSLEKVMREERQSDTTHVMFLLCNNNSNSIEYFSKWTHDMENVSVTGTYQTTQEIVRRSQGYDHPFSFGDYVVKTLLGAVDAEIDTISEPA